MALWICTGCTAAYAVGAVECPQCQCTDYLEADPMPKITVHGGATNAADEQPEAAVEAAADDTPEEESSPGSSSETSSPKAASSQKPSAPPARSRARTTENP